MDSTADRAVRFQNLRFIAANEYIHVDSENSGMYDGVHPIHLHWQSVAVADRLDVLSV
jgi:hypothetical protein